MADELHLTLLGHLEIRRAGLAVSGFTSNKVQALLCYLAVTGRPHLRPVLAGLLWGELPEASAQNSLRKALSNLHQLLGPYIDISRDSAAFRLNSAYWLDVEAFEDGAASATGKAEVEPLEKAVALYRDDFLAGFYVHDAPAFEEWALAERARLRMLALQALHRLAVHYSRLGEGGRVAAIDYTTRLLALEPWREEAHRQLMLLLAASGQRSAALAQYETCRRLLAQELGVEPSAEIREIYDLLLRGERPPDLAAMLAEQERPPRKVGGCPYRGLAAFQEADAPFFFGREGFTARLAASLQQGSPGARLALVGVVGSSGSGKSSTVLAGLLPRLRSSADWLIAGLRPGAQPFRALANALLPALAQELSTTERLLEAHRLADALATGDLALIDAVNLALASQGDPAIRRLLLLVDQFEELYTLCPKPDLRRRFVGLLLTAPNSGNGGRAQRLSLLLTMRADFMGQALAYRPLADALQEAVLLLGPMNRDELRAAIERPAEVQGAAFEAGLVERILDDVGEEPGNLPLLEFALTLLWERHSEGWLTHAGYEEIGRADGALARYADEVFNRLTPADQAAARQVFVQLVRPGEGTEDTRRSANRSELGEENWQFAQFLAGKRLVVTGRDAAGMETVEVVHEALIQNWGQLRGWMEADRTFRAWQERMRAALRQWQESAQDEGALPRGAPLLESEHWLAERPSELSRAEKEFIRAGVASREAGRQRELEAARRLAEQVRLATSRELAGAAVANLQVDPERSLLLGLQALSTMDTLEARNALHQALPELHMIRSTTAHATNVYSVVFSPDGALLATSSHDRTAKIWEASTHQLLLTLQADGNLFDVAFSPGGQLLATSGITDVIVWDSATGQRLLTLPGGSIGATEGLELGVGRIAFSPDGTRLAAANQDGVPQIWDISTPLGAGLSAPRCARPDTMTPLLSLPGHAKICKAIAYSPAGNLLATGGDDALVKIWDPETGQELRSLKGHRSYVWDVAFSPDGTRLVSVDEAGFLYIWDVISGDSLLSLTNLSAGGFRCTLFFPDGSAVLTGGYDSAARVWDAATGRQRLLLAGHTSTVLDAAIHPDGRTLATAGGDGALRIWDLGPGREALTLVGQSASTARHVAYGPAGDRLAVCATDGTVTIWDPSTGQPVATLRTDQPHPWAVVAYDHDGSRLAAGALDGFWAAWHLPTGRVLATISGHVNMIQDIRFSPDDRLLATASWDGTAKVWDVTAAVHASIATPLATEPGAGSVITYTGHLQPGTTSNWVFGVAFGGDGRTVASGGSDAMVRVWDATTGNERLILPGGEHAVLMTSVAYSPDGMRIAGGQFNGPIRIWEADTGALVHVLLGHSAAVTSLEFSADGSKLASASMDSLAKIWDVRAGEEEATLYGGAARVMGIAFSPDGARVAAAGDDGSVRIYLTRLEDLVALARSRLTRALTREECRKYLHTNPCS